MFEPYLSIVFHTRGRREEGGGRREESKRCVILFGSLGSSFSKFSLFQGVLPGNLTFRRL
jgi:hypothetical protein